MEIKRMIRVHQLGGKSLLQRDLVKIREGVIDTKVSERVGGKWVEQQQKKSAYLNKKKIRN